MPRGRPGDRPRAVDGRRRGGEAPARDVAAGASRRARAGAWEMDAVVGRKIDSARPLTLHHGPTGFQLAMPVADGTRAPAPAAAPGRVAARALMDAFGVEMLEPAELDLTPGRVERARADGGEAPLAE